MQTVNIRQLKNNPGKALTAAREDDMAVVMNRDRPQALLVDPEQLDVPDLRKFALALLRRDETYPKRSLRSRRKTAECIPHYRASLLGLVQKGEMRLPRWTDGAAVVIIRRFFNPAVLLSAGEQSVFFDGDITWLNLNF
jgi:hypothetical protein